MEGVAHIILYFASSSSNNFQFHLITEANITLYLYSTPSHSISSDISGTLNRIFGYIRKKALFSSCIFSTISPARRTEKLGFKYHSICHYLPSILHYMTSISPKITNIRRRSKTSKVCFLHKRKLKSLLV